MRVRRTLGKTLPAVKNVVNGPKNMAFVDPGVNRAVSRSNSGVVFQIYPFYTQQKGGAHTSALAGSSSKVAPPVKSYMQQTASTAMTNARKVDQVLKQASSPPY